LDEEDAYGARSARRAAVNVKTAIRRLAAAMLMQAAEDGAPVMLAEIAMRRALNADGEPEPPTPRRKRAKKYRIVR
jgi:hypothetical protein